MKAETGIAGNVEVVAELVDASVEASIGTLFELGGEFDRISFASVDGLNVKVYKPDSFPV